MKRRRKMQVIDEEYVFRSMTAMHGQWIVQDHTHHWLPWHGRNYRL